MKTSIKIERLKKEIKKLQGELEILLNKEWMEDKLYEVPRPIVDRGAMLND